MKLALNLPKWRSRADDSVAVQDDLNAAEGSFLSRLLDRKRLVRILALLVVAAAAGQFMKASGPGVAVTAPQLAAAQSTLLQTKPTSIDPATAANTTAAPSAAAPSDIAEYVAPEPAGSPDLPAADVAAAKKSAENVVQAATEDSVTLASAVPEQAPIQAATAAPQVAEPDLAATCPVSLDLIAAPGAMIKVTLVAPCAPNERVALSHEGLVITGLTTATGALFASIPALTSNAEVEAGFPDGSKTLARIEVPGASDYRRFAVQWQGNDAFQVNAYHGSAEFGAKGHVFGASPGLASDTGGFLQILGDPAAPLPLMAEVYTYPADATPVTLVVESAVTRATCGRELLAETLSAQGGQVLITDLTLAMPDCTGIGDFLVLYNLDPDMTLASN